MKEIELYSITTEAERNKLAELAKAVPDQGLIVEIGTLYGGVTAVLAKAQPFAAVVTVDDFSWHPEDMPSNSLASVQESFNNLHLDNITVIEGDSRNVGKSWARKIDLLWIDGGHSYQFIYSDLSLFGSRANVIALHDYKNPVWPTIEKAISEFIRTTRAFYIDEVIDSLVILRRR